MKSILHRDDVLIPLRFGERTHIKKNKQAHVEEPHKLRPAQINNRNHNAAIPEPANAPVQIDFWNVIDKLKWVDLDDDEAPTKNPSYPSTVWSYAEWQSVQHFSIPHVAKLTNYLDSQNFWNRFGIEDKQPFVWHIIARGSQIYSAVLNDSNFAIGYIGQDCGFIDFMRTYL